MGEEMKITIPPKQLALCIAEKQSNWEISRREIPRPGKGEVVVRIRSTGASLPLFTRPLLTTRLSQALNHFDYMVQRTGIFVDRYPAVVGVDGAGDVEDIGEDVTNVAIGDRVYVNFMNATIAIVLPTKAEI